MTKALLALGLLLIAGFSFFYVNSLRQQHRANQIKHEVSTFDKNFLRSDPATAHVILGDRGARADVEDNHIIVGEITRVAQESERSHLSQAERSKRINAVYVAGVAELERVRTSHHQHQFDVNFADGL